MVLSGYNPSAGKLSGGIRSVCLIPVQGILDIGYDPVSDEYTSVTLVNGFGSATYITEEGASSYHESAEIIHGKNLFTLTLKMSFRRLDSVAFSNLMEMLSASREGITAIIETNTGVNLLAGYNEKFCGECPLKVSDWKSQTGERTTADNIYTITLTGASAAPAGIFTGLLP